MHVLFRFFCTIYIVFSHGRWSVIPRISVARDLPESPGLNLRNQTCCHIGIRALRLKLAIVNLGLISSACSKHFNLLEVKLIFGLGGGREVGESCDARHLVRISTMMCKVYLSTVAQRLQRRGSPKDMSRVSKGIKDIYHQES
jgi:hypothetical protein